MLARMGVNGMQTRTSRVAERSDPGGEPRPGLAKYADAQTSECLLADRSILPARSYCFPVACLSRRFLDARAISAARISGLE
jgi:hypothetical protein